MKPLARTEPSFAYEVDAEFVIVPDALHRLGYLLRRRNGVRLLVDTERSATRQDAERRIWQVQRLAMYDRNFVRIGQALYSFELRDALGRALGRGGQFQTPALRDAAIVHIKQCVLLAPLVN